METIETDKTDITETGYAASAAEPVKENKMGTKPVLPLLLSMAFPPMLSMMIQSLYNIVDSIFVARYSENALTAVSLAFPLQTLIVACSVGIGVGVNSYIARKLGERRQKEADSAVVHGLLLAAVASILFVVIGAFGIGPFFRMFTNDEEILKDGLLYARICVGFCFGPFIHICIEKIFQATGKMIFPMALQAIGAIINIILDPILIFGYFGCPSMGVMGAAVATIIGQLTAMSLSFLVLAVFPHDVKLRFRGFRFHGSVIRQILAVAVPNACMNALGSLLVMGLNAILIQFSNTAVSLFGIYYKLQTFVFMPASGLSQGAMPIMGYNYGARSRKRLLDCLKYSAVICLLIMGVGCLLFESMPGTLLSLFHANEEMLEIGIPALRIIAVSFLPASVGFILPTMFQAMGNGLDSLAVFLLRQLVITLPLAYFLHGPFGLAGIWVSFIAAESVGAVVAFLLFCKIRKKDELLRHEPAKYA